MLSMLTVLPLSVPGAGTSLGEYSLVSNKVLISVDLPRPDSPVCQSMSEDDDGSMGDELDREKWDHPKDRAQLTDYHSDELETTPVSQLQLIHFSSLRAHLTLLLWT